MNVTAFWMAERYIGLKEAPGIVKNNPEILSMLRLDASWPTNDETAWCSAFLNKIAWELRLPRSKSLLARSWLSVGTPIPLVEAEPAFDVVILKRRPDDPGAAIVDAPGHCGFFAGRNEDAVYLLGGNQGDSVCVAPYPAERVLGVRRLRWEGVAE